MSASFLQRIYNTLQTDRLCKKVLIADSFAQGHQWLEKISRSFGPVTNTEVQIPEFLALSHAKIGLYQQGFKYLTNQEAYWIVFDLMEELSSSLEDPYVPINMLSPGIIHCFHRAILELRQAGMNSSDIKPAYFENERKCSYVKLLLQHYEEQLNVRKLADLPELVNFIRPGTQPTIFITQQHLRLSFVQKQMLKQIAANGLTMLEGDCPFTEPECGFPADTCGFFHATGSLTEAREVFRRIAEKEIPWDQVEIIASDYYTYANAVYTMASQFAVACTFSQGVPIYFSSQGRAALLLLDWIESNYNLDVLVTGIKQGLIRIENVSRNRLIRIMENCGIGWGRERYAAWMKSTTNKAEADKLETEKALARFLEHLFTHLPEEGAFSPAYLMRSLVIFLNAYTVCENEQEHLIFNDIKQMSESMKYLNGKPMEKGMAIRFVRDALDKISFAPLNIPQPGKVHFSSIHEGGISGRPQTFIVGMSEEAWTTAAVQDPVLSDGERQNLSPHLLLSEERARLQIMERNRRLGMIRGSCTISFSSFDLTDNREIHPAYEMLQLFRNRMKQHDADFKHLFNYMKEIRGFVLSEKSTAIDETDVWMSHLAASDLSIRYGKLQLLARYHHIASGEQAVRQRANDPISPYDGWIDPGHYPIEFVSGTEAHLSVSKLELFARCPLQFFYREVLGFRVKETALFDRTRWLDPPQRGSLLHDIYCEYYTSLKNRYEKDLTVKHDFELLQRITDLMIDKYLKQIPAPSPHILRKESDSIHRDVYFFFHTEKEHPHLPKYMELPLHPDEGALVLELGEELSIPVKGYVDRVDEIAPHQYKIYDYKTGSPKKYKAQEYFAGGTQLQHALYAVAVEQRLKRTGEDPQAQVVESVYCFPTERGAGDAISRPQNRREDLKRIIQRMLDAMKLGMFPPTHNPVNCGWCDYKEVCGNHAELMKGKRDFPENRSLLSAVAEVNSFD